MLILISEVFNTPVTVILKEVINKQRSIMQKQKRRRKRGILLIASNFLGIVLTTMYISKIIKSN